MENSKKGLSWKLKNASRMFLVTLKRRPQLIPLAVLLVAFLHYSLHLTYISDTTSKIQGTGMGLCGFTTMLLSMLSLVCFNNAFPHRKKTNIPMLVLMFVMFAAIIFADINYLNAIYEAVFREVNPIVVTMSTVYIAYAEYYLLTHIYVLIVGIVLIILLPVYSKLIRKINTNIEVESNTSIGTIDISNE